MLKIAGAKTVKRLKCLKNFLYRSWCVSWSVSHVKLKDAESQFVCTHWNKRTNWKRLKCRMTWDESNCNCKLKYWGCFSVQPTFQSACKNAQKWTLRNFSLCISRYMKVKYITWIKQILYESIKQHEATLYVVLLHQSWDHVGFLPVDGK